MERTNIYSLRDPIAGVTRYVGKTGRRLSVRFGHHMRNARKGRTHKDCWIRSLVAQGLAPRVDLIEIALGDGSAEEMKWIAELTTAGWPLVNATIGGEGSPMRGRTHTPETREKLSIAGRCRKYSGDTVAKRNASNSGRKRTAEQCARISESKRGYRHTDEARQRMRASKVGILHTEERKAAVNAKRGISQNRGEGHGQSKLSHSDILMIKAFGWKQSDAARLFGVGQDQISRIRSGKAWAHIK